MKTLSILGSTGSIGTQALDVIRNNKDKFKIAALTCGSNISLMKEQIAEFEPRLAVCAKEEDGHALREWAKENAPGTEIAVGEEAVIKAATIDCDLVLNSLMGVRGLIPTYEAILSGHDIALANKETLVAGGETIMKSAKEKGVKILPVDSEHSAIFQCLMGNENQKIRRILLTASGGPFRNTPKEDLASVKPEQALNHPNWTMGRKITIDSATMMNKGLEVIEAKWLFDVDASMIEVLVHPESILHSAVEFCDGAVIGQLGTPDMRIPISLALGYPDRLESPGERLDFFGKASGLHFEKPDLDKFLCLRLAFRAIEEGGTIPAIMNGANEVLVEEFLQGRIGFTDIGVIIEEVMDMAKSKANPNIGDVLKADAWAREKALDKVKERRENS